MEIHAHVHLLGSFMKMLLAHHAVYGNHVIRMYHLFPQGCRK